MEGFEANPPCDEKTQLITLPLTVTQPVRLYVSSQGTIGKIDSSFGRARLIIELRNSFDITVAQPVGPDMLFHDRTIINVEGALRAVGSNSGAFVVTPGDYTLVLIIQIFVEGCTDNRSFFQEGSLEVIGVGV